MNQNDCPECNALEETLRQRRIALEEEVVKLRVALARLAQKATSDVWQNIPGNPGREAPYEVLVKCAQKEQRGWNRLAANLMDNIGGGAVAEMGGRPFASDPCAHCECPEAHEKEPERHTPGCESWQGKSCSCSPYALES